MVEAQLYSFLTSSCSTTGKERLYLRIRNYVDSTGGQDVSRKRKIVFPHLDFKPASSSL
jgi:hypothetical protein